MSELPTGWIKTKLGDICSKPQYGYTTRAASAGNVRFLRTTDITKGLNWLLVPYCEENPEKPEQYLLQSGDIVISRAGSVGFSALIESVPENAVFASYLIRFRPLEGVIGKYLKRYLESDYYWQQITEKAAGNALQNVNAQKLADLDVVVAPFAEQTRIAAKLDELLAQVDTLKARIDGIPALLKRFRQSVLAAAVSGRLTGEWRSENPTSASQAPLSIPQDDASGTALPAGWSSKNAGDICGFITKGTTPSKEKMTAGQGEIPYIKVYNLTFSGTLDFSIDPTFVDTNTHTTELKRSIVKPGDVLMNIVGPPLGKVSVVPDTYPEWNINQAIARFRADDEISSEYLALCLRTEEVLNHAVSRAKATAGQFNLTLEICRELPLPVPPKEEQTEIVRRVEQLFAFADQLEARVKAAQARIDRLTQSILAKAFRGELVPQDPNDEPASVLLERIKAQRAAVPKARRGRRAATLS